jgi:hypothetical protein
MTYITSIERIGYDRGREELALKMLRKKYPLEEIAEVTSFSIEELQKLQEKLNNQN